MEKAIARLKKLSQYFCKLGLSWKQGISKSSSPLPERNNIWIHLKQHLNPNHVIRDGAGVFLLSAQSKAHTETFTERWGLLLVTFLDQIQDGRPWGDS